MTTACQLPDLMLFSLITGDFTADIMEPFFAHRSGWRRIHPDLPGMGGQTPGPDWMTNSAQILDVIEAFVDAVIPGVRFAVAGASYGGGSRAG